MMKAFFYVAMILSQIVRGSHIGFVRDCGSLYLRTTAFLRSLRDVPPFAEDNMKTVFELDQAMAPVMEKFSALSVDEEAGEERCKTAAETTDNMLAMLIEIDEHLDDSDLLGPLIGEWTYFLMRSQTMGFSSFTNNEAHVQEQMRLMVQSVYLFKGTKVFMENFLRAPSSSSSSGELSEHARRMLSSLSRNDAQVDWFELMASEHSKCGPKIHGRIDKIISNVVTIVVEGSETFAVEGFTEFVNSWKRLQARVFCLGSKFSLDESRAERARQLAISQLLEGEEEKVTAVKKSKKGKSSSSKRGKKGVTTTTTTTTRASTSIAPTTATTHAIDEWENSSGWERVDRKKNKPTDRPKTKHPRETKAKTTGTPNNKTFSKTSTTTVTTSSVTSTPIAAETSTSSTQRPTSSTTTSTALIEVTGTLAVSAEETNRTSSPSVSSLATTAVPKFLGRRGVPPAVPIIDRVARQLALSIDQSAVVLSGLAGVCNDVAQFSPNDHIYYHASAMRNQIEIAREIIENLRIAQATLHRMLYP
jgi:hypothetical protein